MNAQEAIERVEWAIEEYKQVQMFFDDKTDAEQVERYESLEKEVKALSIVLESAKLLHEHTVPDLIRGNVRFGRSEEYKTVYGVPLEKVGIDLDKVEGEEMNKEELKEGIIDYPEKDWITKQSALDLIDQLDEPEVLSKGRKDLDYQVSLKVEQARQDGYMKGKEAWVRDVLRNREFKRGRTDYAVIEKPVIPNFVAEWIEEHPPVSWWMTIAKWEDGVEEEDKEVFGWYQDFHEDIFIIPWITGNYTVQEKKCRVKYNGEYIAGVTISEGEGKNKSVDIHINFSDKESSHLHTQQELDDLNKYIDVEAEEVTE
ncbi:MAG: DUF1642 domain-containing protein [Alkalibacterium sp.]|nr:DUF1642 domain-containing protein [Alkalibacterium sp.]